jgi:hypothetical protein
MSNTELVVLALLFVALVILELVDWANSLK